MPSERQKQEASTFAPCDVVQSLCLVDVVCAEDLMRPGEVFCPGLIFWYREVSGRKKV